MKVECSYGRKYDIIILTPEKFACRKVAGKQNKNKKTKKRTNEQTKSNQSAVRKQQLTYTY